MKFDINIIKDNIEKLSKLSPNELEEQLNQIKMTFKEWQIFTNNVSENIGIPNYLLTEEQVMLLQKDENLTYSQFGEILHQYLKVKRFSVNKWPNKDSWTLVEDEEITSSREKVFERLIGKENISMMDTIAREADELEMKRKPFKLLNESLEKFKKIINSYSVREDLIIGYRGRFEYFIKKLPSIRRYSEELYGTDLLDLDDYDWEDLNENIKSISQKIKSIEVSTSEIDLIRNLDMRDKIFQVLTLVDMGEITETKDGVCTFSGLNARIDSQKLYKSIFEEECKELEELSQILEDIEKTHNEKNSIMSKVVQNALYSGIGTSSILKVDQVLKNEAKDKGRCNDE